MRGPPSPLSPSPSRGREFDRLWEDLDVKLKNHSFHGLIREEGEDNPLFKEIRRHGVRRELPLIVMTLKALSEKRVRVEKGKVLDERRREIEGICLNEGVERFLANKGDDN